MAPGPETSGMWRFGAGKMCENITAQLQFVRAFSIYTSSRPSAVSLVLLLVLVPCREMYVLCYRCALLYAFPSRGDKFLGRSLQLPLINYASPKYLLPPNSHRFIALHCTLAQRPPVSVMTMPAACR